MFELITKDKDIHIGYHVDPHHIWKQYIKTKEP